MSTRESPEKGRGQIEEQRIGRVTVAYRSSHSDPLIVRAGEELEVGERDDRWSGWLWCTSKKGRSGWMPEAYLQKDGSIFRAERDYDATELDVKAGEQLIVVGEESGWLWCADERGQMGWVPAENVDILSGNLDVGSSFDPECPFCKIPSRRIIAENELAYAVRDHFPVTPRHTLIIPRRHVSSYFDLTAAEVQACHDLLVRTRDEILAEDTSVAGFNIGVNQGPAAGQTVRHCHIHLIPRRGGDVPIARGGVRHVIPGKGCY